MKFRISRRLKRCSNIVFLSDNFAVEEQDAKNLMRLLQDRGYEPAAENRLSSAQDTAENRLSSAQDTLDQI
jgi:hypothetical protein